MRGCVFVCMCVCVECVMHNIFWMCWKRKNVLCVLFICFSFFCRAISPIRDGDVRPHCAIFTRRLCRCVLMCAITAARHTFAVTHIFVLRCKITGCCGIYCRYIYIYGSYMGHMRRYTAVTATQATVSRSYYSIYRNSLAIRSILYSLIMEMLMKNCRNQTKCIWPCRRRLAFKPIATISCSGIDESARASLNFACSSCRHTKRHVTFHRNDIRWLGWG